MQAVTSKPSSKHLLLVSYFFPPMGGGGVQRVTKFIKYLDRNGWRVSVIAGCPEDYWIRDQSLLRDVPPSAHAVRTAGVTGLSLLRRLRPLDAGARRSTHVFSFLRSAGAWLLVPDTYIGWRASALRAAREVMAADPPDVLMSSGPPETNHLVTLQVKRESGVPWLADFRDPWFALHLRPAPTALHRSWHRRLERQVLAAADRVVTTTPSLRRLLERRTVEGGRKIHVIRNGYDPDDFSPGASADPDQRALEAGRLRLVHAGSLAFTRSAAPFLRGLMELFRRDPELRERIEVDFLGARESGDDELVSELGLAPQVRLRGYVPHRIAVESMLSADVLLLITQASEHYGDLVPSKLYEYLVTGRPILALVPESEAAGLLREAGCAEVVSPDDPRAIADALAALLKHQRAGTLQRTYPCKRHPEFERSQQARRLGELLDEIRLSRGSRQGERQ